jgi:hypothetical protein
MRLGETFDPLFLNQPLLCRAIWVRQCSGIATPEISESLKSSAGSKRLRRSREDKNS